MVPVPSPHLQFRELDEAGLAGFGDLAMVRVVGACGILVALMPSAKETRTSAGASTVYWEARSASLANRPARGNNRLAFHKSRGASERGPRRARRTWSR